MHSSRMRTARSLPYWGGLHDSMTETPLDRGPPGQRPPRTEIPWDVTPWDVIPLDREPPCEQNHIHV